MSRILLASASPRRRELLESVGIDPVVCPVEVDESPDGGSHTELAARLARRKAEAALRIRPGGQDEPLLGIAADTLVHLPGGAPLGKPRDRDDAGRMLRCLADQRHVVRTGVAVFSHAQQRVLDVFVVATEVVFGPLAPEAIEAYLDTDEPWDKAGAYAIQGLGGAFVREIHGSWSNVVGLPLFEVVSTLRTHGAFEVVPWKPC